MKNDNFLAVILSLLLLLPTFASAESYPTYPGCESPASSYSRDVYIDPNSGSDTGDGTASKPYKTLETVLTKKIVKPGDHLILQAGDHGNVTVSGSKITALKDAGSWTWLDFKPGATAISITVSNASRILITGATVISKLPLYSNIVGLGGGSNVVVADSTIGAVSDSSSWSASDWINSPNAFMSRNTTCVAVLRNTIKNVRFGITAMSDNTFTQGNSSQTILQDNLIQNFSGDAMRPLASDLLIKNNKIYDEYVSQADGDPNHDDGMQMFAKTDDDTLKNITIEGNWIQETTNPNRALNADIQGIVTFGGGIMDNLQIRNNVVISSHWHGIAVGSVVGGIVENNTVVNPSTNGRRLWIRNTKTSYSTNTIFRNNVATLFALDPDVTTSTNNIVITNPSSAYKVFDTNSYIFDLSPKQGGPLDGKGAGASVASSPLPSTTPTTPSTPTTPVSTDPKELVFLPLIPVPPVTPENPIKDLVPADKPTQPVTVTDALNKLKPIDFSKTLAPGAKGEHVTGLQMFLQKLGFYNYPEFTTFYGNVTTQAVKNYQNANSLEQVGSVGPKTRALIESNKDAVVENSTPVKTQTTSTDVYLPPVLEVSSLSDVISLQRFLNQNGFTIAVSGPGSKGRENGVFGPATRNALKRFQGFYGIQPANGDYNQVTREKVGQLR